MVVVDVSAGDLSVVFDRAATRLAELEVHLCSNPDRVTDHVGLLESPLNPPAFV